MLWRTAPGDAIVVESVLYLWSVLVSRRNPVDLYAHGLLERTRERRPIEEL